MRCYNKQYDAYHDENYVWLEKPCDDPECGFCVGRPKLAPVCAELELLKDYTVNMEGTARVAGDTV